jgi:hypothetical protein
VCKFFTIENTFQSDSKQCFVAVNDIFWEKLNDGKNLSLKKKENNNLYTNGGIR